MDNINQSSASAQGTYKQLWSAKHPGCLILLLDQSGSMNETFGGDIGKGKKKSEMVATTLNGLLSEFIKVNTKNAEVRPRIEVAAIGYNITLDAAGIARINLNWALPNTSDAKPFVNLAELAAAPVKIEKREKKDVDETGAPYTVPVEFPIWFQAAADGATPMCAALERAAKLAAEWVAGQNTDGTARQKENYPPVVINITDGMATDVQNRDNPDPDMVRAAEQVMRFEPNDKCRELLLREADAEHRDVQEFPEAHRRLAMPVMGLGLSLAALFWLLAYRPRMPMETVALTSAAIDIAQGIRRRSLTWLRRELAASCPQINSMDTIVLDKMRQAGCMLRPRQIQRMFHRMHSQELHEVLDRLLAQGRVQRNGGKVVAV